jgi:hypothetical protein
MKRAFRYFLFFLYYWGMLGSGLLLLAGLVMAVLCVVCYQSGWEMVGLPDWLRWLGAGWLTLAAMWMARGEVRERQDF